MALRTYALRRNASDIEIPTIATTPSLNAISAIAHRALDERLERGIASPIVVAFSGGGDSLCLLLEAKRWAERARRRVIAFTVDHGLQPASGEWAAWCAARARRLGVAHETLFWRGPKPETGVSASARAARHRLIAQAARSAGARVILMGHTADDCLEAAIMREGGSSVSAPRPWAPSPVWPDGRGVFILRPLLSARRAAIRAALEDDGEAWIDDPVNLDLRLPRARARPVAAQLDALNSPRMSPDSKALLGDATIGQAGDVSLPMRSVKMASPRAQRAFLGAALLCVAGGETPARGCQIDRLARRVAGGEAFAATLAGARVAADGETLRLARETGDARRAGQGVEPLPPGRAVVWDGRFELEAASPGLSVARLAGRAARLSPTERGRLKAIDPAARRGIPVVIDDQGKVTCPLVVADPRIRVRSLVAERLAGACGVIQNEAAIWRVAESHATS